MQIHDVLGRRRDGCLIFHNYFASVKYRPFLLFADFLCQGDEDADSDDEPESVYEPSGSAEEEESSQEEYSSETETSEDESGENRISAFKLKLSAGQESGGSWTRLSQIDASSSMESISLTWSSQFWTPFKQSQKDSGLNGSSFATAWKTFKQRRLRQSWASILGSNILLLYFLYYDIALPKLAISELPLASFSKRVLVLNLSNENQFLFTCK